MTTITPIRSPEEVAGELAGRLFEAGLGAFEWATVTLGVRLGLYRALSERGPSTVQEWLPAVPDLHATLQGGGTVAELGCGEGWAAIALAVGYPGLRVDGFDVDPPSIEAARRHAEEAGVADRARFVVADVTDPALTGRYDAVLAFEMLHDLAHPVAALRTARRLTTGPVIVVDERVAESFSAPADPMERFFYAASVLHCLPVGRCEEHSAATGTVMRPDVLRRYADEAGFTAVTVLPIENDMFRFYRLEG